MTEFNKLVEVLKAAGEVTRLRLLALLANGELSVKDLTDILGQSQPRVSRHLKLLAEAGLVVRNAEGAWAYYRVADSGDVGRLVSCILEQLVGNDRELAEDRMALEKVQLAHRLEADKYFSKVARDWDKLRKLHVSETAVEAAIVRHVGEDPVDSLLDLGTGTGRMLELLSGVYRHGTGIDSSREMIGVARAKLAAAGISHAQIRLGDIANPEGDSEPADLIVLHQVLHYFDDPGRIIAQARSCLAESGRILVVDFASHNLEYLREHDAHRRLGLSNEQMAAWAKSCDLEVAHFEQIANELTDGAAQAPDLNVCLWILTEKKGNQRFATQRSN